MIATPSRPPDVERRNEPRLTDRPNRMLRIGFVAMAAAAGTTMVVLALTGLEPPTETAAAVATTAATVTTDQDDADVAAMVAATADSSDPSAGTEMDTAVNGGTDATTVGTVADENLTVVASLTDVSAVVADVSDSVVRVEVSASFRGREGVVGSGSGVIVGSDGLIVTNAHVVETGMDVSVELDDGTTRDATIVEFDAARDLAILAIDASGLDPIELGSSEHLLVGEPVIAIGYPLGLEGDASVSTGIVSALNRTLTDSNGVLEGVIQTDAAITEGSSGGALLDADGNLIGITTAVGVSSIGIEGIGFAIPVESIASLLASVSGI